MLLLLRAQTTKGHQDKLENMRGQGLSHGVLLFRSSAKDKRAKPQGGCKRVCRAALPMTREYECSEDADKKYAINRGVHNK